MPGSGFPSGAKDMPDAVIGSAAPWHYATMALMVAVVLLLGYVIAVTSLDGL